MGLAEGIATGASRTINTVLDKRQEEASAARKFMMKRRIQEADRYNADMTEAQEQFDAFVGLVGEGNMDKAAQIMKGAGSSEQRQELLNYLTAERRKNKDFDILAAYDFSERKAGEFGRDDYLRTLVSDPVKLAMPASEKIGLGLADKMFGKQPDMAAGLMPVLRGQKIEEFAGAKAKPGAFSEAEEFERAKQADIISLDSAKLQNEKLMKEIAGFGALNVSQVKSSFATMVAGGLTRNEIPATVDTAGNVSFQLKDASANFNEIKDAYTSALKSITEDAISTEALGVEGMRSILKTNAQQTLNYAQASLTTPKGPEEMVAGQMYNTKEGIILYVGTGDGFDKDDYIVVKQPE